MKGCDRGPGISVGWDGFGETFEGNSSGWWFGKLFVFFHILGIIILTD
jgi:hypothetical protein